MKKNYLFLVLFTAFAFTGFAQNSVTVDANATQNGYANVFELPANGGGFVFGQPWGVADLKTVVDTGANTLTLQPNFNTYADNPTDPFWVNQTTGEGNKIFEGNTYVEDNSLVGSELTFSGGVVSNSIDADYAVDAFIKVFNSDFSVLKEESVALAAGGSNFSITYTNVEATDAVVQYGFRVTGVNANPDDETPLGSVVVGEEVLAIDSNDLVNVAVYPNPSSRTWTLNSANKTIISIEVYDMLGNRINTFTVNGNTFNINNESLSNGIYFAKINSDSGTKTVKLVKN